MLFRSDSVRSLPSLVVNSRVGYRSDNNWRFFIDGFNLFNTRTNQIEYYYGSRLSSEPSGVSTFGRHVHPVEPLAVRFTVAGPL